MSYFSFFVDITPTERKLKTWPVTKKTFPKICEISNILAVTQTHTTYYIIKFRYYFLEYFNSLNNMRTKSSLK